MTWSPSPLGSNRHSPEDREGAAWSVGSPSGAVGSAVRRPSIGGGGASLRWPWPRRARGESEDGGATSMGMLDGEDERRSARPLLRLGRPWSSCLSLRLPASPSGSTDAAARVAGHCAPAPRPGLNDIDQAGCPSLWRGPASPLCSSEAAPFSHEGHRAAAKVLGQSGHRAGAAGTIASTPTETRTPAGWEGKGRPRGRWTSRPAPSAARALCTAGAGAALWLRLPLGGHRPGLSCSGPSCPPPAPACSAAAAAGPAHPSPGQPGSRPCTW